MEIIIANFFDFSVDKFKNPCVIIGIILMVIALVIVFAARKIDDKIIEKRNKTALNDENEDEAISSDLEPEETPLFRNRDGSVNWFMILKLIGLVLVIASAILVVVGLK